MTTINVLEIALVGLGTLVLCAIIFILTAVFCAYQMKKKLEEKERKDQYEHDLRHPEVVKYHQGPLIVGDNEDENDNIELEWMP